MNIRDAIDSNFRLLDADWPRIRALDVAERTAARYVVVRRKIAVDMQPNYYVLDTTEVREKLRKSQGSSTIAALNLYAEKVSVAVALTAARFSETAWQVVMVGQVPVGVLAPAPAHRGGQLPGRASSPAATVGAMPTGRALQRVRTRGPSPASTPAVSRELSAEWPESIDAGSRVALLVSLELPGTSGPGAAPLTATLGTRIDIVVRPQVGVILDGTNTGTLVVSDPQDAAPLMFRFKAGSVGDGSVRIYAYSGGYSVASMDLRTAIVERGGDAAPAVKAVPFAQVHATVPAEPRTQPDLSLLITETGTEIGIRLQSNDREFDGTTYPPVKLAISSRDYFADFCRNIENLAVDSENDRKTSARKLGLWGAGMIERLLPPELRTTLWTLKDRIGSVQITSDEAWIPWEVCRLVGTAADGAKVEGPFLAEAFCVTRWLHGVAPPPRFRFGEWALVVPRDSRLPSAAAEESFVLSMANERRKVTQVAANFCDLTEAMESEVYHAWHFCGHANAGEGGDGDKAAIALDDRDTMTADLFSGTVENALRTRPFIFFNACQSARGGLSLTGVGGWAHRFLKPASSQYAASAFLGSYWSVYDTAALQFSKALYEGLMNGGKQIGQAVRDARLAVRTPADPLTWLAYTVYADPLATVDGG